MAFTVTATQSATTANGMLMAIKVLTGVSPLQGAAASAATATQTGAAAHQASITTTVTGSRVYGAAYDVSSTALTVNGSTTALASSIGGGSSDGLSHGCCRTTSATGTPGAITIGYSAPADAGQLALLEIIPSGTITENASSPAAATSGAHTFVTSASFSPPAGSLLVAMVSSNHGNAGGTITMSDTSGLGLVWTQGIIQNSAGITGVWYAFVPSIVPGQQPRIPRRYPSRAIWQGVTGPANAAPAAPAATGGFTARPPAVPRRGLWRGITGTRAGTPATGGSITRRTAARGLWRAVTGQVPPPPGTSGGKVSRRNPARAVWRGLTVPAAQPVPQSGKLRAALRIPARAVWRGLAAPGQVPAVAVPAPKQVPQPPRRTSARAVWRGTQVTTRNVVLVDAAFTAGAARSAWAAGKARSAWTAGAAKAAWEVEGRGR